MKPIWRSWFMLGADSWYHNQIQHTERKLESDIELKRTYFGTSSRSAWSRQVSWFLTVHKFSPPFHVYNLWTSYPSFYERCRNWCGCFRSLLRVTELPPEYFCPPLASKVGVCKGGSRNLKSKGAQWNAVGSCPPVDVKLRSPYRFHGCNHVCQRWRDFIRRYSKRFQVCIPMYRVPTALTHIVASIEAIGAP